MRAIASLAVLVLAPLTDAFSQERFAQPGQHVRITAPSFGLDRAPARFEGVRRDTLRAIADTVLRVPLGALTRLDVSRGRSILPVALSAVVGAAAGTAIGLSMAEKTECPPLAVCFPDENEIGAVVLGAGLGALAGGALGAVLRTERWRQVTLDGLRVGVMPRRDGFGVGARIAF